MPADGGGSRWQLPVLVALCGAPFVAAWLYALNPELLPASRRNHGTLVQPPQSLAGASVDLLRAVPGEPDERRGSWRLLWVTSQHCDDDCRGRLRELHAVRRALGAHARRLRCYVVVVQPAAVRDWDREHSQYSPLAVVAAAEGEGRVMLAALARARGAAPGAADGLYVIDPRGGIVLTYPDSASASGVLDDLKRLVKNL